MALTNDGRFPFRMSSQIGGVDELAEPELDPLDEFELDEDDLEGVFRPLRKTLKLFGSLETAINVRGVFASKTTEFGSTRGLAKHDSPTPRVTKCVVVTPLRSAGRHSHRAG